MQEAERFVAAQEARGWRGNDGRPVRDWRAWFDGWYVRNAAQAKAASEPDPRVSRLEEMKRRYLAEEGAK